MRNSFLENWATQLRKGFLELCILNGIRDGRLYGYEIVRALRKIDGLVISEGTIYPILSRLKREGLVETNIEESSEGPARKYYRLTKTGEAMLSRMNAHWSAVKKGIDALRKEPER